MYGSDEIDRNKRKEDLRCIWMTAGILSYQLCDREFDCDHCQLDAAMGKQFARPTAVINRSHGQGETVENICYAPNHLWMKPIGRGFIRIGIEQGLSSLLLNPRAVVLPAVGDRLVRGDVCLWIVLEGGTLPLTSPLDGVVSAVNAAVNVEPHEIHLSPLHRGWLLDVSCPSVEKEMEAALRPSDAGCAYSKDEARFKDLVIEEMKDQYPAVGLTLADGGQVLRDVAERLGAKRYFRMITKWLHG